MEDYNKIIESLSVSFIKAKNINILNPVSVRNNYDVENTILYVNKGQLKYGEYQDVVEEGDILFVPGGKMIAITYGSGKADSLTKDDFLNNKERYFQPSDRLNSTENESYCYVSFEAKVFDSVNFFASLDIPAFVIKQESSLGLLIKEVVLETFSNLPGKERLIKIQTERLVVELIRYIITKGLFVEQFATNSTYFKDPRLIDIFTFIKEHLGEDLSNKILANVANVSEDYVGQYFKMLTGINPQDYIEYQRMEMAVNLLGTTKKSIREIGKEVGYKDTAYFCRRFKMMFGIPAGKMRRRESLINV
ncbi:MAG: AraC family transcriptional regulator [bacterium]|nr:AraC family transcriptional regulator [bacterium]